MTIYQIDPIADRRWSEFLEARPDASAFHTVAWLETLRTTYGYQPVVFTTSTPGSALTNGIVFCEIKSWLTGRRWVSLPFADHCTPLYEQPNNSSTLLQQIAHEARKEGVDRVEIRPINSHLEESSTSFVTADSFKLHLLDLRPTLEEILRSCDRSSVQRRLKHANRENLKYEEGTGDSLLRKFYHLMVITRRRHGVPPQPLAWFRNLLHFFGGKASIRVTSVAETPIAGVLTLAHNRTVIYKYGGSDEQYHKVGGMVSLFWHAIQAAKSDGAYTFDMGRSDLDNPGLIRFKANWGAQELALTYLRSPQKAPSSLVHWTKAREFGGNVLSHLPKGVLVAIGNALYRHAG